MKCPIDDTDLAMTERQGIEIDYCPKCRGVWLDRGELDKIIERSTAAAPEAAAPQPQHQPPPQYHPRPQPAHRRDDDDRHYEPRYKKKKSFLGEIFDF